MSSTELDFKKIEVLGAKFNLLKVEELIEEIQKIIFTPKKKAPLKIANHNLHGIFYFHNDEDYKEYSETADFCIIDSIPIVWFARFTGKSSVYRSHRNTPLDYVIKLLNILSEKEMGKVFVLGGTPSSNTFGVENWKKLFPKVQIQGLHGCFDWGKESDLVVNKINLFEPDLLIVCLGMPLQEKWSLLFASKIKAKIILTAGGLIDYYSGKTIAPPRWIARLGFEWFYRFICDPKRLFFRYFIEPWFLVPYVYKDIVEYIHKLKK